MFMYYALILKFKMLTGKHCIRVCVSEILVEFFKYKTIVQITISWCTTSNENHCDVSWNGLTVGDIEAWYKE